MALAAIQGDQTLAEPAQRLDVHANQIGQWRAQLLERAAEIFASTAPRSAEGPNLKELHPKIGQPRPGERFLVRRARSHRRSERKTMIEREHRLPVVQQAVLLALSRSSLYYEPKPVSEADLKLMRRIDELHLELPFAGARMLRDLLKREGIVVGRKHVPTLMRRTGIEAIYRRRNTSRRHPEHAVFAYRLRGLAIDRPNQVWAADITYIPMARGFVYLVAILDWCTRKVLAWQLSNSLSSDFCVAALEEAIARYGVPEIFNTDQGSQPGFNWSSQRSIRSDPNSKIFIALQSDANAFVQGGGYLAPRAVKAGHRHDPRNNPQRRIRGAARPIRRK